MIISTHHLLTFKTLRNACLLSLITCAVLGTSIAAEALEETTTIPSSTNYTVSKSIPVDKLVQTLYANSPLNTVILRKALVEANPKIISGNPQQRVKAGVSIVVPDHAQVVKAVLAPIAANAPETQESGPIARDYSNSRRQWVRFP